MASLSPQSAGGMVQSIASRLKGQGDVPSSVLLPGGKMITRGNWLGNLLRMCHTLLEEHKVADH